MAYVGVCLAQLGRLIQAPRPRKTQCPANAQMMAHVHARAAAWKLLKTYCHWVQNAHQDALQAA